MKTALKEVKTKITKSPDTGRGFTKHILFLDDAPMQPFFRRVSLGVHSPELTRAFRAFMHKNPMGLFIELRAHPDSKVGGEYRSRKDIAMRAYGTYIDSNNEIFVNIAPHGESAARGEKLLRKHSDIKLCLTRTNR